MLEIRNITKQYKAGGLEQIVLDNFSVCFRKNEFVSILGQSGAGKTTLLNILGGLDRYDSGDILINGISTKEYTEKDWNAYRNKSIGFVFQSYNLISHQSVLANVEVALTLAGVSKRERKKRAYEALKRVGLESHANKKPNQLSGGQQQRVAIARAIINNPDIILADEPTGALDENTSTQVMDILKDIAKDRLVIMVTHNPELAQQYSTRIIKMRGGKVESDSDPYSPEKDPKREKTKNKTALSISAAMALSAKNLMSKKGRTILTAIAGSIGIIGIALIMAVSNGVNQYIDQVQSDTLSSFPIQIQRESTDITSLISTITGIGGEDEEEKEPVDGVRGSPAIYKMMNSLMNADKTENDMKSFLQYLNQHKDEIKDDTAAIQLGYDIDLNVYAKDQNGNYIQSDFSSLMTQIMEGGPMMDTIASYMDGMGTVNIWQQLIEDPETGDVSQLIKDQYELVYGKWPEQKDEILLVLNKDNEISDITLYALGLVDKETMVNATMSAMNGKNDDSWAEYDGKVWSYEDICNIELKMVLPVDYYQKDAKTGLWNDISQNDVLLDSVISSGLPLKISGIIKPSEDATAAFLSGSLCYTRQLTDYYIEEVESSQFVKEQTKADKNLITGMPFMVQDPADATEEEQAKAFLEYAELLSDAEKSNLLLSILSTVPEDVYGTEVDKILNQYQDKTAEEIVEDIAANYAGQLGYSPELIRSMLGSYEKQDLLKLLEDTVKSMIQSRYETAAKEQIDIIRQTPSEEELAQFRTIVESNLYESLQTMPEYQQAYAKAQIQRQFSADYYSRKTGISADQASAYIAAMAIGDASALFDSAMTEAATQAYVQSGIADTSAEGAKKIAAALENTLNEKSVKELSEYYEMYVPSVSSETAKQDLLKSIGVVDKNDPAVISLYPVDFHSKDTLADFIAEYNQQQEEDKEIQYTDISAMLMSSVSGVITAISTILIAFVSISLVVSSVMIGIITYISVLERTKEIGILRAVGASKKDISLVFNAETILIGFASGLTGIFVTAVLCMPISAIARSVTGIQSLTASVPWYGFFLVFLSVALTWIAGLIPSKIAANKDPVIALRTE